MTHPKDSEPSSSADADDPYPVPCTKCGAEATLRGVNTVVGEADLLQLTIVCGGCRHSWVVERSTLPKGLREV